ncbi:YagK/YfjJ domain-containing protein [Acinetobacter junii]|uniref:YagK/YfjJ domain-containing protein n=1 Tax=Acinetobacter junii TaxID=40215 RepID=UPI00125FA8FB|nr:inovirus-type Gp2 protein [Acinetobacter junii]
MIIRSLPPKSKLKSKRKHLSKLLSLRQAKEDLQTVMFSDDIHQTIVMCPLDYHIDSLIKRVEFVLEVVKCNEDLIQVTIQQVPLRKCHYYLNCAPEIFIMLKALSMIINYTSPPDIIEGIECQAFRQALQQLKAEELEILLLGIPSLLPDHPDTVYRFVLAVNRFIFLIRSFMNKPEIKRKLYDRSASCNRMKNQCIGLVTSLIKCHSKILVIRLDFYLTHEKNTLFKKLPILQEFHSKHDLQYLKDGIKRLLRMKRNHPLMKDIIGHILRYEYTPQRGFHIHSFFFLDANKHREDITIGQSIAEIWNVKITNGQGSTNICNMNKASYRYCGIGMIHHSDVTKLKYLFKIFEYICKADQFFVFSNMRGPRRFQLSAAPKNKSNAGRPRKVDKQSLNGTSENDNNMEHSS